MVFTKTINDSYSTIIPEQLKLKRKMKLSILEAQMHEYFYISEVRKLFLSMISKAKSIKKKTNRTEFWKNCKLLYDQQFPKILTNKLSICNPQRTLSL